MAEEDQARLGGHFAEGADGGLGPALDRLGRCEDGGILAGRQLGDAVEVGIDGRNLSRRHSLRQGALHLPVAVADQKDS